MRQIDRLNHHLDNHRHVCLFQHDPEHVIVSLFNSSTECTYIPCSFTSWYCFIIIPVFICSLQHYFFKCSALSLSAWLSSYYHNSPPPPPTPDFNLCLKPVASNIHSVPLHVCLDSIITDTTMFIFCVHEFNQQHTNVCWGFVFVFLFSFSTNLPTFKLHTKMMLQINPQLIFSCNHGYLQDDREPLTSNYENAAAAGRINMLISGHQDTTHRISSHANRNLA